MSKSIIRIRTFLTGSLIILLFPLTMVYGDEINWMAIGSLHDWFSSAGCEVEVGRTHAISDQQDGLRWPALYRWQDTKAAKALWIGAKNYDDPLAQQTFDPKVVHVGPRVLEEPTEIMPMKFEMTGRSDHPNVIVDGLPATELDFMDFVDRTDPNLVSDRVIDNVVHTAIGVTIHRKIYAYSQQNHDNYFIYDYVFTNTGIVKQDSSVTHSQTLEDVVFHFQYRYAPTREAGIYGKGWLPQSAAWGHATMNDTMHVPANGATQVGLFSYLGKHSDATYNTIGGPNPEPAGTRVLGADQHVGVITLHADGGPQDAADDPAQPFTTMYLPSDDPITSSNDQFNQSQMAQEYNHMTSGHPDRTQAEAVGDGYANEWGGTPGGFSHTQSYGPYTLAPGDSIHIVQVEAVAGLSRQKCYEIGEKWYHGEVEGESATYTLPDGSTTDDPNEYKDQWVFTGKDSLKATFQRAMQTYKNGLVVPDPPPAPRILDVNSGGDRISLDWAPNAESWPNFQGYRVYRAIHTPDTLYDKIFECGPGTDHPEIVNTYDDRTAKRGFDYYYYVTAYDDGSTNSVNPGTPLESSKFYTMTNEPAYLRRPAGDALEDIRIVPNPYNIKARSLQFGESGPNRLMFYNLPPECTIKIYTERGDLVKTLEHTDGSGDEAWDSVTSSRQTIVSGLYIAVIEKPNGDKIMKKFIVVR